MTPSLNTEDFFSRGAPSDATNIGQFLATNREPILGEAAPPWVFVNPMSLGLLEGSVTDAETWQDELSSDQHSYGPCIYSAYIYIYIYIYHISLYINF